MRQRRGRGHGRGRHHHHSALQNDHRHFADETDGRTTEQGRNLGDLGTVLHLSEGGREDDGRGRIPSPSRGPRVALRGERGDARGRKRERERCRKRKRRAEREREREERRGRHNSRAAARAPVYVRACALAQLVPFSAATVSPTEAREGDQDCARASRISDVVLQPVEQLNIERKKMTWTSTCDKLAVSQSRGLLHARLENVS